MKKDQTKKTVFNTSLDSELLIELKVLAIRQKKRINEIMEEAIRDLLKKHKVKIKDT